MHSFAKALIAFGIACQFADAAPSAFNYILPRDDSIQYQYDTYYQEVVQIVAMTSTVYVDAPKSSPTPSPQDQTKEEETPKPSSPPPTENKAIDTSSSSSSSSGQEYSGKATYYTPGMGSCGWTNTESDCIVALSSARMAAAGGGSNGNKMCGQMVDISCGGSSVSAKVVDTCPGCGEYDIDLSPSCFEKIASKDAGKVDVSWKVST